MKRRQSLPVSTSRSLTEPAVTACPISLLTVQRRRDVKGVRLRAKIVLLGLLLASAAHWFVQPLYAVDRHWTGSADNVWSNPNNWNPVGLPAPDDVLLFDSGGGDVFVDLVDVTVDVMQFYSGTWQVTGNELLITNGLDVIGHDPRTVLTFDCPIRLEGSATDIGISIWWGEENNPNQAFFRGPIDLNGHNLAVNAPSSGYSDKYLQFATFSGVISGDGDVSFVCADFQSDFELGGPQPNTFTGSLTCIGGGVNLNKDIGPAVNSRLKVAGIVHIKRSGQIAPGATVEIQPLGQLVMEGHNETFTDLEIGGVFPDTNFPASVFDMAGATVTLLGNLSSSPFHYL
jgi:hypothetical protein